MQELTYILPTLHRVCNHDCVDLFNTPYEIWDGFIDCALNSTKTMTNLVVISSARQVVEPMHSFQSER
jgi:hypothetical protein